MLLIFAENRIFKHTWQQIFDATWQKETTNTKWDQNPRLIKHSCFVIQTSQDVFS